MATATASPKAIGAGMDDRAAAAPGFGMFVHQADHLGDEIGRHFAVAVDAHDQFALGTLDGHVQARGDDPLRIVDHLDERIFRVVFGQDLARVVVRHSVGHDDFHPIARIILGQNLLQAAGDERTFVPHDHNRPK